MERQKMAGLRRHLIEIAALLTAIGMACKADGATAVADKLETAASAVDDAMYDLSDILGVPPDAVC